MNISEKYFNTVYHLDVHLRLLQCPQCQLPRSDHQLLSARVVPFRLNDIKSHTSYDRVLENGLTLTAPAWIFFQLIRMNILSINLQTKHKQVKLLFFIAILNYDVLNKCSQCLPSSSASVGSLSCWFVWLCSAVNSFSSTLGFWTIFSSNFRLSSSKNSWSLFVGWLLALPACCVFGSVELVASIFCRILNGMCCNYHIHKYTGFVLTSRSNLRNKFTKVNTYW